jgi:hypothetical protein
LIILLQKKGNIKVGCKNYFDKPRKYAIIIAGAIIILCFKSLFSAAMPRTEKYDTLTAICSANVPQYFADAIIILSL